MVLLFIEMAFKIHEKFRHISKVNEISKIKMENIFVVELCSVSHVRFVDTARSDVISGSEEQYSEDIKNAFSAGCVSLYVNPAFSADLVLSETSKAGKEYR
jgi:hypothetical protein